jgi:hypothetical protein
MAPQRRCCLRQQGTSPFFIDDFCPAGQKSSIKGRKSTTLPKAEPGLVDDRVTPDN